MAKRIKKAAGKAAAKSAGRAAKKVAKKVAPKKTKKAAKKAPQKAKKAPVKAKKAPGKAKKAPMKTGKKFLIIYHVPVDAMEQTASSSPEEMAEGMAQWKAWAERVGSKLADLGAPLVNGIRLDPNGSSMPSTRDVTGYSLLEAEDLEEVMDLLLDHPHISGWHPEATIEVHEAMLIPGM
ncbi:MAG: hypothetical protein Q8941_24255 [Bacteroidota bacterium]|nr:hypothetical protein [Bacteroidota bacterium]